jgi:hypothetical protein
MDEKRIDEITKDEFDIHPEAVEVLPPMTVEELDVFLTEEDHRSLEEAGLLDGS